MSTAIGMGIGIGLGTPPSWTPAKIKATIPLWLEATKGITLAGANVATWVDYRGSGNALTGFGNPAYVAAGGASTGVPVVRGNGSSAYLQGTFAVTQPITYIVCAKWTGRAAANYLLDGVADYNQIYRAVSSTTVQMYAGLNVSGPACTDAAWDVFVATFNGASSKLGLKAEAYSSGDAYTKNAGGITLMATKAGLSWAIADVYGMLAIISPTASDVTKTIAYFRRKVGF